MQWISPHPQSKPQWNYNPDGKYNLIFKKLVTRHLVSNRKGIFFPFYIASSNITSLFLICRFKGRV